MTNEFSVITTEQVAPMMITWDLGRRCNYDCTYCPPNRHDSHSPHAPFEELKQTARYILEYCKILMPLRKSSMVNINFTGGEPTVNPDFINLTRWMRETFEESYNDFFDLEINLTTNGATSKKICDQFIEHCNFATISYHCEGPDVLKKQVVDNIRYFKERGFPQQINVMFHARSDYFNECLELCRFLYDMEIPFTPRMIGDHGSQDLYCHKYTPQQLKWFKTYWDNKENPTFKLPKIIPRPLEKILKPLRPKEEKKHARSLGRPCCGGRDMKVCQPKTMSWEKTRFLTFTEFEDWYCSVNWFFLHIEQQTDRVFHHQTCQANFGKKREPIGKVSGFDAILENLKDQVNGNKMPIIRCPNQYCGCGLCTPKAKNFNDFKNVIKDQISIEVFENSPEFNNV